MDIRTIKEEEYIAVKISGEFTVSHILKAKEKFMDLIEENLILKIDLSDVTEFDSSALQLLYAFSIYMKNIGTNVEIAANNSKTDLFFKTYGMEI